MGIPDKVYRLVKHFDANLAAYKRAQFDEAQVRIDFINPLLKDGLGWDVDSDLGLLETYREVVYEDRVKVGGGTMAPDYGFYLGGHRRFFLEAKKPSVDLLGDIAPAVQLRRYAWSANLPLSILTDCEELASYGCRFEPIKTDRSATARLNFITYDQYADRWDELYSLFSREAVIEGALDKFAEATKRKRGTQTVDDVFLKEIESWREQLARNLAIRNGLNQRQLNYAVQMTIDRIIFLRMAEDRGIEEYGRLLSLVNGNDVYGRLCEIFREADDRYNSGLFHFRDERGREEKPDTLTPSLEVGDRLLRRIIRSLYYPESPYEFSVLPVDVLGQVYEQFLGKVIRLEDGGHKALVEEKPEVRKAGGVYYTPTYIVDYIVENTVGKLLEGKTPKDAAKLKILDPACGSGTFPLGAFQYLLDWHLKWFTENTPDKWLTGKSPAIYQNKDGYQLTTAKKKEILLNNIFGVDIDAQAVEVTKLSLLLKVLEGENQETIGSQLSLLQERVLPDLGKNIQCGNSLIGPDYYEGHQLTMSFADDEERYRVNVFDWKGAFPQVFIQGGFDVVIGNPPYLFITELEKAEKDYYFKKYKTTEYRFDVYGLFAELSTQFLLKENGYLSFIIPHTLLSNDSFAKLRK